MTSRIQALRALVDHLCSPECAGRATGSPESAAARRHIIEVLEAIGVEPAGTGGYLQPVPASKGHNVLARLRGRGKHAERAVLIAAHYDHLGRARGGLAYAGADDNAAAVAILADTAARLREHEGELGREIIFAWFDAEEPPHFLDEGMGSQHWVNAPTVPLERVDMMICMDLMGHALGAPELPAEVRGSVFALGAERSRGTGALVDEVGTRARGVHLRRLASEVIPAMSDYAAFEAAQIPFLFLTCGRWKHYHSVTDTPEKLDYEKMRAASDVLFDLAMSCSTRPVERFTYEAAGRDDRATLASMEAVARALAPFQARAGAAFLRELEALGAELKQRGELGRSARQRTAMLVAMLESALQS